MTLPLAGIRVVALEQAVAAPLCTRHLADLGADVVKVERPEGDFARRYDAVVHGESAHFVWLNRGKRSVVLDLKVAGDREVLGTLLARADVFVHNLGPGAIERLGLGWDALHARRPRLVSCAISGYGMSGPYRDRKGFDLLVQGESGVIATTGTPEQPAKIGVPVADISGGMYALAAILAALYERERTGVGRLIEIALLETLAEWTMAAAYHQLYAGAPPRRSGLRHSMVTPYGPYRVADGTVCLAVQTEGQWQRLCREVLGRPKMADDPRFRTNPLRVQHRAELESLIEKILSKHPCASVVERLEAADVPYGVLNDLAGLLTHPQLAARKRWFDVDSPSGPIRAFAHPMNIEGMPQRVGAVPALGEHTAEVRRELGL